MAETTVAALLDALGIHLALGTLAAAALHLRGLAVIDPSTVGARPGFRILVTPGLIALWPLLILRWSRVHRGPDPEPLTSLPGPDHPIGPRRLRRWQAVSFPALLLFALLGAGVALSGRTEPWDPPPTGRAGEPLPLAGFEDALSVRGVLATDAAPVSLALLGGEQEVVATELRVAGPLGIPSLALYWSPQRPPAGADSPGREGLFVGRVPSRPGTHRLPPPLAARSGGGAWILYSIAQGELVAILTPTTGAGEGGR